MRPEVMQRHNSFDHRCEGPRDRWIANVGNVPLTFDIERMNLRAERPAYLRRGAGEINYHTAGANLNRKPLSNKPRTDLGYILGSHPEMLSVFRGAEPLMKLRRSAFVKFIRKPFGRRLVLGRALELQLHPLQREGVFN